MHDVGSEKKIPGANVPGKDLDVRRTFSVSGFRWFFMVKLSSGGASLIFSVPGLDGYSWGHAIKCVMPIMNVININRLHMGESFAASGISI